MDVQVEEAGTFYRKLSVTVPQTLVDQAFDSAFKRVAKGARIPGFRPGKAPRSVLQAHYGPQISAEVQDSLVQQHLPSAMAQSEVTPVARPALESASLSKGKDFKFVATVEIQPDIELTKWEGLEIEKVETVVEDAELEARLDSMRQQHSQMVPVEDRTVVESGDFVSMDYEGFIDGEAFEGGKAEGAQIEVGGGSYLPGFEKGVEGATVPSDIEFPVEFPEDYQAENLAGKTATFKATLHELKAKEIPALDDDFAQDVGEDNVEALKAKVSEELMGQKEKQSKDQERQFALKALVAANPFEVAPSVVDEQAERMIQNAAMQMQQMMGYRPQLGQEEIDNLKEENRPMAEEQVRGGLLLMEVTKAAEIEVGEEDIDAEIAQISETSGQAEQVAAHFKNPQERQNLKYRLLEDRTVDAILEKATRIDPKPEPEAAPAE
jgi:trigger factor